MKKLLLLFLFSGSLDAFSQDRPATVKDSHWLRDDYLLEVNELTKPDTVRCTLIVYHDGRPSFVHTKAGYVVWQAFKDDVYLDEKKRVIKGNIVVLTYKVKK